jgi:plasmid maintenance system killer protein
LRIPTQPFPIFNIVTKPLEILDAAVAREELRALPSNHLEASKGDRNGQFSVRINMQWRIFNLMPATVPI